MLLLASYEMQIWYDFRQLRNLKRSLKFYLMQLVSISNTQKVVDEL